MKISIIAAILSIGFVLAAASCGPKRDVIPFHGGLDPAVAEGSAILKANAIGGASYRVSDTHSMEPYLALGDFVVVDTHAQYKDIKVGWMITYQARWLPPSSSPVTHWCADKLGNEFIMDGQNNEHYENSTEMRMGEIEFNYRNMFLVRTCGRVVEIYSSRKEQK